jgi:hypothetical protein
MKDDKKTSSTKGEKRRKDNKTLSQKKRKEVGKKTLTEDNKKEGTEDKVPTHELLASTLSYLMSAPW